MVVVGVVVVVVVVMVVVIVVVFVLVVVIMVVVVAGVVVVVVAGVVVECHLYRCGHCNEMSFVNFPLQELVLVPDMPSRYRVVCVCV